MPLAHLILSGTTTTLTEKGDAGYIDEYDITSTPNDFNIITLYNYISAGFVKIPGFQRHYVWSLPMASRLIESLILGLPVPQLFLYEEGNNRFLVIDGPAAPDDYLLFYQG